MRVGDIGMVKFEVLAILPNGDFATDLTDPETGRNIVIPHTRGFFHGRPRGACHAHQKGPKK